mgnify:CR=1 FL=1
MAAWLIGHMTVRDPVKWQEYLGQVGATVRAGVLNNVVISRRKGTYGYGYGYGYVEVGYVGCDPYYYDDCYDDYYYAWVPTSLAATDFDGRCAAELRATHNERVIKQSA